MLKNLPLPNEIKEEITFKSILMWYLEGHDVKKDDFVFFGSKKGNINYTEYLGYQEARKSLITEQALLGLEGLTLHSARIGGATEAAEAGIGRAEIQEQGNWKSRAVDLYIRPKGKKVRVSEALMNGLKL